MIKSIAEVTACVRLAELNDGIPYFAFQGTCTFCATTAVLVVPADYPDEYIEEPLYIRAPCLECGDQRHFVLLDEIDTYYHVKGEMNV